MRDQEQYHRDWMRRLYEVTLKGKEVVIHVPAEQDKETKEPIFVG